MGAEQDLQNMQGSMNELLAILWPEIFVIVAFGFLVMAFLQVLKDVIPVKVMFNKYFLLRWIGKRMAKAAKNIKVSGAGHDTISSVATRFGIRLDGAQDRDAEKGVAAPLLMDINKVFNLDKTHQPIEPIEMRRDVAALTTEANVRALCSLRADQLAGQLTAAAQHVVDYPQERLHLLALFAADAKPKDVLATYFGAYAAAEPAGLEGKSVDSPGAPAPRETGPAPEPAWLGEYDDAKSRVQYHVQRAIDQLMISMNNIWYRALRVISVMLGLTVVVLYFGFGVQTDYWLPNTAGEIVVVITTGIVSGYLATVFHDILMRLQSGRGRE